MAPSSRPGERGFTLAGVVVIATLMMIVVAYTVPRMWSAIMQRERERQTIFVMKQYARAIEDFRVKNNGTFPVSVQQIVEAKQPRYLRGNNKEGTVDPLTGQVDWLVIPQAAAGAAPGNAGGGIGFGTGGGQGNAGGGTTGTTGTTSTTGTNSGPATGTPAATGVPGIPIKDYAGGPFIGIRPNKTGQSQLALNGQTQYELWSYTAVDYQREVAARKTAYATVYK
jgi:type II secretory pathway pseudopilin PulG